ncbi:unnamed protein product, partial [Penicillium nalgiovense]
SRDRHLLARLQRYYHTDENLDTNRTGQANQTPRVNVDRRRYGSAMQISATTRGTVDSGRFYLSPAEKLERIAEAQTRSTSPMLSAVSVRWYGTLLPRRYCWGGRVFGITADFGDRMVGYNSIRGCIHLVAAKRK